MKAVRGKDSIVSLLSKEEFAIFTQLDDPGTFDHKWSARQKYLIAEMYKRNLLRQIEFSGRTIYVPYPQRDQI